MAEFCEGEDYHVRFTVRGLSSGLGEVHFPYVVVCRAGTDQLYGSHVGSLDGG